MTSESSFDIFFEKFNEKKRIMLQKGFNVVYGESGSGKTELVNSLLENENFPSKNFLISNQNLSHRKQLVFQNPENQIVCPNILSEVSFGIESNPHSKNLKKELLEIQSNLPFVDNWLRHPNTLSGGEMEILNIVTAFTSTSDLVLIDDGLSYLNESTKKKWINWIKKKYGHKTILWFTSDHTDLKYGVTKWMLSLSSLQKINHSEMVSAYNHNHSKGSLSIQTNDLNFSFNDSKKKIINSLSINLSNSRSLGIIGNNGSGKTTFVELLTDILEPSSGKINMEVSNKKPFTGVLNQFPERMLGHNTLEKLLLKLIDNNKFDHRLINSFKKKLKSHQINWNKIKNKRSLDLSWSAVRIILVIMLSLSNFNLIVLDEPTFGLGFQQKIKLSKILRSMLLNKHLILVSHDTDFIQNHCDHVIDFDSKTVLQNKKILTRAK